MTKNKREQDFLEQIHPHQGIIHKVSRMYCDSVEDRADLFQEILLQLWRAYGNFKGDSSFSTWMYRVAINTAISGFRKQKRRPHFDRLSQATFQLAESNEHPDQEEKRKALYQAIRTLSDVERALVMLHLEGHSYEEISDIIGITRTYVGVKLNRIKSKLRTILVPHFQ